MYLTQRLLRRFGWGRKPKLPELFSDSDGPNRAKMTLANNAIIAEDSEIIKQFWDEGQYEFFRVGDTIVQQDSPDIDVYFLLSGEVDVVVGAQKRSIREAPNQIGEMSAIDLGTNRTATIVARSSEVATLKVPGTVFKEVWSRDAHFQARLQKEMSARHRESLAATKVAKENTSFVWFLISVGIGLLAGILAWILLSSYSWTTEARLLTTAGGGVISFLITLLHNPAFFWRRCFGVALIAMIGIFALDSFFSLEASQGFGSLQITLSRESGTEDWAVLLVKALVFIGVLALCAFMERKEAER
ncbi:Cyclic nucleotide-binding domain protein [Pseudovibrio sp. W64]|uniref:cyclic nucleotide-binding domain-containing protein n=1 Tax=Pseudovibrio sp. W64 TaxID=1735583 RepID=UPI0007AE90C0|nr:cyclic nucleotide-binding domain-containing protein [Pseudovibrio sp. W64]KZK76291.1 Cyclic nucleotide-binding domain protein [Pseudovibrio sp. W64]